jgi:membrane protein DedA with SNARE-associated domain
VFTLLGCIPWVLLLGFIGDQVGHNWTHWRHGFSYLDYVMAALIVAGIAYWIVRRVKARGEPAAQVLGAEVETDSQRIPAGRG